MACAFSKPFLTSINYEEVSRISINSHKLNLAL